MGRKEFEKFMNMAFLKYDAERGRKSSQAEFAGWLELPPETISRYMRGLTTPSGVNLQKLADRLGPGIYDALGVPRRMPSEKRYPELARLLESWHELTPDEQEMLATQVDKIVEKKRDKINQTVNQIQGKTA